jgi:hypothetical protein
MFKSDKIKPLKCCDCNTCKLGRGSKSRKEGRKAANRRIRRSMRQGGIAAWAAGVQSLARS